VKNFIDWVFNNYSDERQTLIKFMQEHLGMKVVLAEPFVQTYSRFLGAEYRHFIILKLKLLSGNADPAFYLKNRQFGSANPNDYILQKLVQAAYVGYKRDLRRGKYHGTKVELAIWYLLYTESRIVDSIDSGMASYISERALDKFPNLITDSESA
jgi:hypothetical protein